MKKEVGVWLDHRQAVLVINLDQEEEIKRISSDLDDGGATDDDTTANHRKNNQLNKFYDEVIVAVQDATSILILGPGEAKVELQKRLEAQLNGTNEPTVTVKSADKLTEAQVAAEVRQHFK